MKQINEREPHLQQLTDEQLKAKTAEFRFRLSKGASLDDLLVEAFAVVREVSNRVLRLRHFDAQMVGHDCRVPQQILLHRKQSDMAMHRSDQHWTHAGHNMHLVLAGLLTVALRWCKSAETSASTTFFGACTKFCFEAVAFARRQTIACAVVCSVLQKK